MNSKTKEYIRFKQKELFPRWWAEAGGQDVEETVKLKCHVPGCKHEGYLFRKGKVGSTRVVFSLVDLDVGHTLRRGSHPELICDFNNCKPECRYHNSLYAGVPMWSHKR